MLGRLSTIAARSVSRSGSRTATTGAGSAGASVRWYATTNVMCAPLPRRMEAPPLTPPPAATATTATATTTTGTATAKRAATKTATPTPAAAARAEREATSAVIASLPKALDQSKLSAYLKPTLYHATHRMSYPHLISSHACLMLTLYFM